MDCRFILIALGVFAFSHVNGVELTGQFGSPLLAKFVTLWPKVMALFPCCKTCTKEHKQEIPIPHSSIASKRKEHKQASQCSVVSLRIFPEWCLLFSCWGIQCHNGSVDCGKSVTRHVYMGPGAVGLMPTLESRTMQLKDRQFGPIVCAPGAEDCGVSVTYHVYPGKITHSNVGVGNDDRTYVFAANLAGLQTTDVEDVYEFKEKYQGKGSFHKDLIQAVCHEAGKRCTAMYDDSRRCFRHGEGSGPRPGTGLLSRNYDGCIGWAITPARKAMVAFTDPYLKIRSPGNDGAFFVKEGNPDGFDPTDLTTATKKIALINVFAHYGFKGLKRNEALKGHF
ncbi:uncharacterized protein [Ptychodera flava]|uniref:uncharacterized protein n=1 Tax=Ptychodera flava TaxID=63121 RepID=UPI003969ED4F